MSCNYMKPQSNDNYNHNHIYERIYNPTVTGFWWQSTPASMAMVFNESNELLVFFWCPWSFLEPCLLTAWWPSHILELYMCCTRKRNDVENKRNRKESK